LGTTTIPPFSSSDGSTAVQAVIDSLKRVNWLPLGSGALGGTTFPINRELVAELLGFETIYPNSMDAVSDRDFILEFLSIGSIIMTHISRFSEELVIWSSQEFQFVSGMTPFAQNLVLCHKRNTRTYQSC
jgi:argininosuccinate lyase